MKCHLICFFVLLLSTAIATAEEADVRVLKDIPYLGEGRSEKMDLYLPPKDDGTLRPAILIVHGGGWSGGDKAARRELNIGNNLARAGYVCASINYRLAKKNTSLATRLKEVWPGNLHDCQTAVRFLRKNAEEYQIDPENIGAIGGSAGGHLVAILAYVDEGDGLDAEGPYSEYSCRVQAVIPLYGVHKLIDHEKLKVKEISAEHQELLRQASPITWLDAEDPPALIMHGTNDKTVPVSQSELLHAELKKAKIWSELIIIEGAPHTFHLQPKQRDLRGVVIDFFDKHLKGK